MKKRVLIALLVSGVVFGGVFALAATLGGLTSNNLGADDSVVASCDTDGVSTAYVTAYDNANARYEVNSVTVSGIAAGCNGQTIKVTLTDGGTSLQEGSTTVAGTSQSVTMPNPPSAEDTDDVHVLIYQP